MKLRDRIQQLDTSCTDIEIVRRDGDIETRVHIFNGVASIDQRQRSADGKDVVALPAFNIDLDKARNFADAVWALVVLMQS